MSELKQFNIKLRDLQSLLQKKFSKQFSLIDYWYESLVPIGENYGSTVLKVLAIVRMSNEAEEGELHLVAKMLPPTAFQRLLFDSSFTFRKEIFLYEKLVPSYQCLEREFSAVDNGVFDILPIFYGARFSLRSDVDFDDDAVLLMENLKFLGYYTADRRKGLDLPHCKITLAALARFHALGIAMKEHKSDEFEIIKAQSKCRKMIKDEGFKDSNKFFLRLMQEDSEMGVHSKSIEAAMGQEMAKVMTITPPEPWGTIIHNDFWVNNIMFHEDPLIGQVDRIKFVDFQNYLFLSPMRDLTFFLMTSLSDEVTEHCFDELIDHYYDNFLNVLRDMKCDVQCFRRDKFDERMRIDAFEEFPHIPFLLRIISIDVENDFNPNNEEIRNFMLSQSVNSLFLNRLRTCVKKYAEKFWFN